MRTKYSNIASFAIAGLLLLLACAAGAAPRSALRSAGLQIRWLQNGTYGPSAHARYLVTVTKASDGSDEYLFRDQKTGRTFHDEAYIRSRLNQLAAKAGYPTSDRRREQDSLTRELRDFRQMIAAYPLVIGPRDILPNAQAAVESENGRENETVRLTFTHDGQRKLADFSSHHTGETTLILLDGRVISVSTIEEPITDATLEIAGGFQTGADAQTAAKEINSGAEAPAE